MPNYLIVATSGRALAQGLKILGYSVAVVDGFADCDTRAAAVELIKVKRSDFGLDSGEVIQAVRDLQSRITFDGLFYDAALESNPNLLDEINIQPVFGNSSQTLKACKNPKEFFARLDQHSIAYPETYFEPQATGAITGDWLIKTAQGTGGVGVAPVSAQQVQLGQSVDFVSNQYLQKRMDGVNFSITFLANFQANYQANSQENYSANKEIQVLGFNTLWNEKLSESMPYAYSGAINELKLDQDVKQIAQQYAQVLVKEFSLVGLNSIDFIVAENTVHVLEINPRIPATYELYETRNGELIRQHIEVCNTNVLPVSTRQSLLRAHAIVYAPEDIRITENMLWPLWSSDRPHAGEIIRRSEPVCNVFAGGQNSAQVCEMIESRKQSIISKLLH